MFEWAQTPCWWKTEVVKRGRREILENARGRGGTKRIREVGGVGTAKEIRGRWKEATIVEGPFRLVDWRKLREKQWN